MLKCVILPLVLSGSALALAVWAQNTPPSGDRPERPFESEGRRGGERGRGGFGMGMNPLMQALDTDKDGELSAAEIANAAASLKKLDKNGDGKLSADELRPAFREGGRGGPRADNSAEMLASLMAFDKNSDGKLTSEELPERMRNIIARADADKDGAVTKEELTKFLATQNPRGNPGEPRPERGPGRDSEPPR